jgi:drug/metabolite transporter (DMT)-like permease
MKPKGPYQLYAALAIAGWSLSFVFTRICLRHFSPLPLAFLRHLAASAAIGAISAFIPVEKAKKGDAKWFNLAGACGFFLYSTLFNIGSRTVPAAASSFLVSTAPVFTALLAARLFREKLGAGRWAAIALELSGVAIMAILGNGLRPGSGFAPILLGAFLLAFYNAVSRRLTKTYSGFTVAAQSILRGTAMLALYSWAAFPEALAAPPAALASLAAMGVFCSAISYACWSVALSKAEKAASVSNFMFATPLATAAFAFFLLGEPVEPATAVGGAVIMLGFALFSFQGAKKARRIE